MSFFLLGRGPEGDLFLISDKVCASRQAALAELSSRTADASFTHWDAEVLVMNLEQGTPVLLVRPAAAAASTEEQEQIDDVELEAQTADETESVSDDEASPEEVETEPEEAVEAEPDNEPVVEPEDEPEAEPSPEVEVAPIADDSGDDDLAQVISGLEDETESLVVEEAEPVVVTGEPTVTEVETTIAEAVLADIDETENAETGETEPAGGSLKDALMRTAASMHAEGIVPPESVGPAEASGEASTEDAPEPAAEADGETAAEPAAEPDVEIAAEPEVETEVAVSTEPEVDVVATEGTTAEVAAGQAWPWDSPDKGPTAPIHHPDFAVHALDEPSYDDGPLIHASGDDATMAASRPVILGSYGEQPAEVQTPEPVEEAAAPEVAAPEAPAQEAPAPETATEEAPAPEAATEEAPAPEAETEEAQTATPEEVDEAIEQLLDRAVENIEIPETADLDELPTESVAPEIAADSDFIVDLPAPPSIAAVPEGGYSGSGETGEMSCNDCVYVETCPNKGQRDPRTCGSFQWK